MKLYLVRHGDALEAAVDRERPLSPQGVGEAEHVGYFLKRTRVQPSFIFHSALRRAAETAEIVASILGHPEALREREELGPENETEPWAAELGSSGWGRHCILVGHLPFLPALAANLLTGSEDGLFLRLPTGSVMCLESEDGWCLRYLATARMLAAVPRPEPAAEKSARPPRETGSNDTQDKG
jgi:phosphohistidine phosphatase